jgi:hypothetical protein
MASGRLAKILRDLERHKHIFDLDQHDLAEALMDIDVEVMLRDMDAEVAPDGTAWPRLSERYERWKARAAPGAPMAVLYGHMKTREQLEGLRRVTAREATMVYGIDDLAREVATYFQEGAPGNDQPPRPFYGLSAEADARKDEYCRKHLEKLI